ncbi:uncharacterized protein LOC132043232 isoform X3 [Lycium ferocissimum]|uniref:uncharacterized protein LOC132043232 isoform X3 n=1 Tax=Lycium ferocissimum TaxID=112874 RepID=UPI002815C7AF|nr:uncharacterized protein LOC132043232 isoform X3 [Lycium ferocissimum]
MQTNTGHAASTEGVGMQRFDVPDIGMDHRNGSGETLKASTEELQEGGDNSGEQKESTEDRPIFETPPKVGENVIPLSQFLLLDELFPSQTPERRMILHPSVAQNRRPSKYQVSHDSASGKYI